VNRLLAAPLTELLEFDLAFNRLLVSASIIITVLADRAAHRDQIVRVFNLSHIEP
jgi:hypothetical protein